MIPEINPTVFDLREADSPQLSGHLAFLSFKSLARIPLNKIVVDCTIKRRTIRSGMLLAISYILSKKLRAMVREKRIGIVLPPGIIGYIGNLAVVMAGKSPVNLNVTTGSGPARSSIKRAGIRTILTVSALQERFSDFPWTEEVLDLVGELKAFSKFRMVALFVAILLLPGGFLARILKVPRRGGKNEAALLFTSGSSGEPKGVVLSHRNIIANIRQIDQIGIFPSSEVMLACLPLFHSFGFTGTCWYPILKGLRVVTVPSPLEVKKIVASIRSERATILLGTPTFLRPYLRKAQPEDLRTLKYVVVGAEKMPKDSDAIWEDRFGSRYLEGYGLTETTPVVAVNLPWAKGFRKGSVGCLFPGMAARVVDPEEGRALPLGETGVLQLQGPNVFSGYLDDPEQTAQVFDGDWLITGDFARIDRDGFIYIEGRLTRFSKIGGEMVPHGTIEQAILEAFDLEDSEGLPLMVTGRPDPAKGEVLVLLTKLELDSVTLGEKLIAAGFPNLWIPKDIRRVDQIPILANGKVDLKACRELALG